MLNGAKVRPIQHSSLPSVISSARAFSLARHGSKRAGCEHVEERIFVSSLGAARICGAIPRKLQNRASANWEVWAVRRQHANVLRETGPSTCRVLASFCSSKLKRMPWQEVLQTLGNCPISSRTMYCGEKCWIQRDSLLAGGENVSICLPSRASRVRVPSPAPSQENPGPQALPENGARQSL